ncbi:uncharacterized [Tachysurus ichikawai]
MGSRDLGSRPAVFGVHGERERKQHGDCERPEAGRRPFALSFLTLTVSVASVDYCIRVSASSAFRRCLKIRVFCTSGAR